ncbi:MAG TPA: hypothetical protein VFO52_06220, partial [Longimicrobiales bacterium]|nr:hypothetical protein [Longimicrobiales bacterium]
DAGFRTYVAYIPELEAGIIAVGNDAAFNPGQVSRDVTEAFFGDRMAPPEEPASPPAPPRAQPPWTPTVQELEKYVGVYYSPELETRYQVMLHKNALVARHRRNGDITLSPDRADKFRTPSWYFSNVDFERDGEGKVTGMRVSSGRVRQLLFERIGK